MKTLFVMDEKDYSDDMPVTERVTVRALIERDGRYAMQKSKFGEYKMPGGAPDEGESHLEALIREVREETGLTVIPETVTDIGKTLEIREDALEPGVKFIRHTYFYRCSVLDEIAPPHMTRSEVELGYSLAWATISEIIEGNKTALREKWNIRDTEFFRWLQANPDMQP